MPAIEAEAIEMVAWLASMAAWGVVICFAVWPVADDPKSQLPRSPRPLVSCFFQFSSTKLANESTILERMFWNRVSTESVPLSAQRRRASPSPPEIAPAMPCVRVMQLSANTWKSSLARVRSFL